MGKNKISKLDRAKVQPFLFYRVEEDLDTFEVSPKPALSRVYGFTVMLSTVGATAFVIFVVAHAFHRGTIFSLNPFTLILGAGALYLLSRTATFLLNRLERKESLRIKEREWWFTERAVVHLEDQRRQELVEEGRAPWEIQEEITAFRDRVRELRDNGEL